MDRTAEVAEPLLYDCADQIEATGIDSIEVGRKIVAVGLSRIRASIDGPELAEELNWLSAMLAQEAKDLLREAAH